MTNRTISPNAVALGVALKCSIPSLRKAAIAFISKEIRAGRGMMTKIPGRLGIAVSTYQQWLAACPELKHAHDVARDEELRRLAAARDKAYAKPGAKKLGVRE